MMYLIALFGFPLGMLALNWTLTLLFMAGEALEGTR